ncbi:unnamed protein product [Protopolystoma xenopodis]|uniref:Uncharacterized protein n=1 Tax=Protopolystoma xenopodis TaxID=117903 RepID=A0A448WRQ3_9PLAT|nr:unnamed protein product [Protopolystoma xenopodis]
MKSVDTLSAAASRQQRALDHLGDLARLEEAQIVGLNSKQRDLVQAITDSKRHFAEEQVEARRLTEERDHKANGTSDLPIKTPLYILIVVKSIRIRLK